MAREDVWALLQAAAKPELRKVFAAMGMRPCWLDTGESHVPMDLSEHMTKHSASASHFCILVRPHNDRQQVQA